MKKGSIWPVIIAVAAVAAFTIPIFKSGGKENLTLISFLKNHSIFHDDGPLYIPSEDYMKAINE